MRQILGMGMAGARIAGGDFFPAQQLAAAGGAALACQWSEPSLLHLTHSHIHPPYFLKLVNI